MNGNKSGSALLVDLARGSRSASSTLTPLLDHLAAETDAEALAEMLRATMA